MEQHLSEFLFVQLILILSTAVLTLVGFFLKRHLGTTDVLADEVKALTSSVTRLLERDRLQRLADYKQTNGIEPV